LDQRITEDTDVMAPGLLDFFGFVDLLFAEEQSGTKVTRLMSRMVSLAIPITGFYYEMAGPNSCKAT
jgi:hypothetical protein